MYENNPTTVSIGMTTNSLFRPKKLLLTSVDVVNSLELLLTTSKMSRVARILAHGFASIQYLAKYLLTQVSQSLYGQLRLPGCHMLPIAWLLTPWIKERETGIGKENRGRREERREKEAE